MSRASPQLPFRSGQTGLSDDELLLYDAVFALDCLYVRAVSRDAYSEACNTPYTHSLSDSALHRTLEDHVARGLLRKDVWDDWPVYGLTPDGGSLWEAERQPVWELYCDAYWSSDTGHFGVRSPSAEASRSYFDAMVSCEFTIEPNTYTFSEGCDQQPLVWRVFDPVFEIRALGTRSWQPTTWKAMQERRTWWTTIAELQRFVPRS